MQFHRLRLTGFKSFVEPTELYIEPGITAVVGPNGCGKSNLIEALRWVMGESSPKSLRSGGMEDVIFAGTMDRPARNFADVTLLIDNSQRRAPAAFNDSDQIEVSRRIERDAGSAYRINGREVRQRDVQLLFADAATGAQSPAMVSQGRISQLISAKPRDRRAILEEAAGISGLHSRRHEAELRLRAAENNILRLDDVMVQIETQHHSLKRQARQATRYKSLSARIRETEALLLHLRWTEAGAAVAVAERRLGAAQASVAERTERAAIASTRQAETAAMLPDLRDAEATAAAALHRLAAARESLNAEERRAREIAGQLAARRRQITDDSRREQTLIADAKAALMRLGEEREALGGDTDAKARAQAEADVTEAHAAAVAAEAELDRINAQAAAITARRAGLDREIEQTDLRLARLADEARRIDTEITTLCDQQAGGQANVLDAAIDSARAATDRAREAMAEADQQRQAAVMAEATAREALSKVEAKAAKLNAEASALAELLDAGGGDDYPPVIDSVTVEPGYEAALGAALGDDLSMPVGLGAPIHWRDSEGASVDQALPSGAEPLAARVQAPPALARRLSQIGVIDSGDGRRLAERLLPGQRLVSTEGGLWRWDGYTAAAGAVTTAAARLEQRNRLEDLWAEIGEADRGLADRCRHYDSVALAVGQANEREMAMRRDWRAAEERLSTLRDERLAGDRQTEKRASRLAAAREAGARIATDIAETEARSKAAKQAIEDLSSDDLLRRRGEAPRARVELLRTALARARGAHDSLERVARARAQRLQAIDGECEAWSRRAANAREQSERLAERGAEARRESEAMADRPAEIERLRLALVAKISDAEAQRRKAADGLAGAETGLAARDRDLKAAQQALAEARELRVRAEAESEQALERQREVARRIAEELDCEPHEAAAAAGISNQSPKAGAAANTDVTAAKLDRLKRERDNMGPVNLRAEAEARELDEQLSLMTSEKADLESAIARLRQAIGNLNREGRERLLAAFSKVDKHFRELFEKLFGGGRAHLSLTDSDDPLDAGLEIMASPPGKKLQSLSLLSGGEQALTALALIFAVFLTNPAPICVLDEVDAPLDDANVGRFCRLMQKITKTTRTRFVVVTHHPLTMSHVDRLFGVTMGERGISQLVSVDLGEAARLQAVG